MSNQTSKNKKNYQRQNSDQTIISVSQGVLECYSILAKNEYSDDTIGLQAYLMRKSVGSINFSELIDECDKRSRQGQSTPMIGLLEERRRNLPANEASIEKCMILNRLIEWIKEDQQFTSILSNIRLDMQYRLTDHNPKRTIEYPIDLRKRIEDFEKRQLVQEKRRLFYYGNKEVDPVANLVQLQNRTTEQLSYVINQLNTNPKQHKIWTQEIENILKTSVLIVAQPHNDVNPTTIYERKSAGLYTAKISVFIVSLLHDFMQKNPNVIELYDIEPSLCPSSDLYKLDEPQTLPWKTCEFRLQPDSRSLLFKCAEMTNITIGQTPKSEARVRFAQGLHTFKFAIKFHLHLINAKSLTSVNFTLESLPFAIAAHNSQIPQLLTRLILDDIQRFNKSRIVDPRIIQNFVERYFIHRTGVRPNMSTSNFLEQELIKASHQRGQTLEENYLDFLVHFVQQVEFMAKHPILSVFHADKLFLGICNSERAAEAMVQTCGPDKSVIGLRFNSIRVEYNASTTQGHKAVRTMQCAVRVDIYNDRTKKLQNRTFDSNILASDISKFVSTSDSLNTDTIRVLSSFDDKTNARDFLPFQSFIKYSDDKLRDISKSDDKYKPVTDLIDNAIDASEDNLDDSPMTNSTINRDGATLCPPMTPNCSNIDQISNDPCNTHEYASIGYGQAGNIYAPSPISIASPLSIQPPIPTEANNNNIIDAIVSNPEIMNDLLRRLNVVNVANPIQPSAPTPTHNQHPQLSGQYQNVSMNNQMPAMIPHQVNHALSTQQHFYQSLPQTNFDTMHINHQQYPPTPIQFPQTLRPSQHSQQLQTDIFRQQNAATSQYSSQTSNFQYPTSSRPFQYQNQNQMYPQIPLQQQRQQQPQQQKQQQQQQQQQFLSSIPTQLFQTATNGRGNSIVHHRPFNSNPIPVDMTPTGNYQFSDPTNSNDNQIFSSMSPYHNDSTNLTETEHQNQTMGPKDLARFQEIVEFLSEDFTADGPASTFA